MDPSTLLLLFAVLACPIGMVLMMRMMNRQDGGEQGHSMSGRGSPASQVERLKTLGEQRRLLEQEIAEAERILALEAKKAALASARSKPSNGGPHATMDE